MSDNDPEYIPQEEIQPEDAGEPAAKEPSLVLNVYSWWTPILAIVMLVVGLVAGYLARPYITASRPETAGVSSETSVITVEPTAAGTPQATADPTQVAESRAQMMTFLVGNARHFLGDENAPITMIEFSDFQWPYCGRFATGAGRQITDEFVKTGKVRLIYWHFAFLGDESQWAAEASECAGDQNKFWEYHDLLFEKQNGENQGAFSKDNLKGFAKELGLDTTAFNECLDSGKYTSVVQQETGTAQQIGVQSTPSFVVNGVPVIGAQPYDQFVQMFNSMSK
jgi:protein-disulfide isomerase